VRPAYLTTYQIFYFQDDWKVRRNLVLSWGLRYEREGPPTERHNQMIVGFDFGADSPIASAARASYAQNPLAELPASQFQVKGGLLFAGAGGNPRTAYDADTNNFAPRLGVAYEVNPNTVIRAGYGIFFIPDSPRAIGAQDGNPPGFASNTIASPSADGGLTFNRTLDNLFPNGLVVPTGSAGGLATFLGQNLLLPPPRNLPNAYSQSWKFSIQRRLGGAHRLEARYIGRRTVKMPISRLLTALDNQYLSKSPDRDQPRIDFLAERFSNPFRGLPGVNGNLATSTVLTRADLLRPFPEFAQINRFNSQGWSTYHGLQLEFERAMKGGFTVQANYTFSKTIDGLGYLNAADPLPERVISDLNYPHMWKFDYLWELPFGKGRRFGSGVSGIPAYLIGGWQFAHVFQLFVPQPQGWGNILFRGNIKDIPFDNRTQARMFNIDAGFERDPAKPLASNVRTFPSRLAGVTGGLPATLRRSGSDITLVKSTKFADRFDVQFRAEAFNIFNQLLFAPGNATPTSSAFGVSVTPSAPRTVQLGLKVAF